MHTANFSYWDVDRELEGYVARRVGDEGRRPAVLVCHAWAGQSDFERRKAEQLAGLGYVGIALDVYGKGVLGTNTDENSALMAPFIEDRAKLRERLLAGVSAARELDVVDPDRMAVIGFCFGGLCAIDLARWGTPGLRGAVSFHGLFGAPDVDGVPDRIDVPVLALHGRDDPFVPPEQVESFMAEMAAKHADWQVHVYGDTIHAFTNPEADDPEFGTRYSAVADRRSWVSMCAFLDEVFA